MPRYLQYLLSRFVGAGGVIVKARLSTEGGFEGALEEAAGLIRRSGRGEVRAWVNATGIGAGALVGDDGVEAVRGVTVRVKGEIGGVRMRIEDAEGRTGYVIPRIGDGETVLGGTREVGVW